MDSETKYLSLQDTHNGGIIFFLCIKGLVVLVQQYTSNFVLCYLSEKIILLEKYI